MGKTLEQSVRRVFSGAAMLLAGFVLGGILNLAIQVVIARLFSPDLYGVFSQALALVHALVMLSILGMNAGTSRFISFNLSDGEKAEKAVASSLLFVVPASLAVFVLLFVFAGPVAELLFQDTRTVDILRIMAVAGPAMAVNSIIISGFRGFQSSKERVILLDLVVPLLQLLGISILVLLGYGLFGATAGYTMAFLFTTAVAFAWYRSDHEFLFEPGVASEIARFSWPIMVSSVAVQLFLWGPPVLVGMFSSSTDVGLLNSALPIGAATKMFLSSVAFLFMPVISEHYARGELEQIRDIHGISTKWVFNFALPSLAFAALMSRDVISLLFGAQYADAGIALSIIAGGYLVSMLTGPIGDLLIAVGNIKREMAANLVKLALFTSASVALIPSMGFIGGAAAYAGGMAAGNILRLWFGRRFISWSYPGRLAKSTAAVVPASISVIYLQVFTPNVVIDALVFGAVYSVLLLLLKPLAKEEKEMILDFLEQHGLEERLPLERITAD